MSEPLAPETEEIIRRAVSQYGGLAQTERRALLDEIDRLRAWKAEAMEVHAGWEEVWQAAGRPGGLGGSKAVGVREEIDRLRAALAEIRRLDEWSADTSAWPGWSVWPMIRAVYNDALGADR